MPHPYVYAQRPPGTNSLYVGALVTYIVGLFTFLPHFVSLIFTFVMVNKNLVNGARKGAGTYCSLLPRGRNRG